MRTRHTARSKSFTSRALLAVVIAVLGTSSGRAPVRAQQPGAQRERAASGQSVTMLPDGRWLVIGGEQSRGLVQVRGLDGTVTALKASPLTPRAWHTATVLADGSVLIVGGTDARGNVLAAPERFVPGTATFELLPADGFAPRANHTATLLTDGRVLIIGGRATAVRDDADVWDPVAERAAPLAAPLQGGRLGHSAVLQADGQVIVSGGSAADGRDVQSAEIFDPSSATFHPTTGSTEDPTAFFVTSVTPRDGARDVALEASVTLRFSQAAAVASISDATISLSGPDGPVAARAIATERGRLVFIRPAETLQPSTTYQVRLAGLVGSGRVAIAPAVFSFTTNDRPADEARPDDEAWMPNARWSAGRSSSPWQSLPPLAAPLGATALAGQVLRMNGAPLADVTLTVLGRTARTDRTGRFLVVVDGVSTREQTLEIDARTANRGNKTYGFYEARIMMKPGVTTVLPFTIWSPVLDTAHAVTIASPTTRETVVSTPTMPGLELHLPAGTVIRDEDGAVVRKLTMTPIPLDRTPFPLPSDAPFTMFFTIQPGGAYISTPGPIKGAWLVYPNRTTFKPGTKVQFFNYDPDDKGWFVYGLGTVTRTQVVPDARTRFYAFTGASFNSGPPPPQGGAAGGPPTADPVDPSTGAFIMTKTDLSLPDVLPLSLTRTYNAQDSYQRAFGTGMTHAYGMFQYTTNSFNTGEMVLPDGLQIHYVRISADGLPWDQTVFENQTSPTAFYKSRITFTHNNWECALKDGTVYSLGHMGPLQAIRDRYGNETRLTWSETNLFGAGYGNLVRVTSPNGRWIEFTYDSATPVNHVTQAKDNIGRTVTYTYDANGNLHTVTDPENNVTTYTWDTSNRLASIKDGRNITWLTNQYDTSNRVTHQTLADPSAIYGFAYTTDGGGSITQTDVTDPRGHVQRFVFNAAHQMVTATQAYGTSLQRTTTITRQTGSDLPTAIVDPLNRRTEYTYDARGHVLTLTRLAGTPDAVTTTFTYEPVFAQIASVTDPLSHTWSLTYDGAGRLTSTADPLSHQSTITLSPTGQVTQTTDPLQHSWQFGYTAGDLTSLTDPLGQVRSQFVDQAGRTIVSTDPLGRVSRTTYDKVNRVTSVTDPLSGVTSLTYDANSNLLSVSDALSHTTSYTYDASDRLATRTDPLSHAASYTYDHSDHLTEVTDRKGQVTSLSYDGLDRLAQLTYDDSSTVTYTYDAGDRVTQIVDSMNGTITRQYDALDRLTEETTPEGTIDYTYDADGRRSSMTVAGQAAVTYAYDDAHRLTSITKGTATAVFAYDEAGRRSSLTYPNGIVASYSYDNANRLLCIGYALGSTILGDLTYAYDAAGNPVTRGGVWARTGLPPGMSGATYDAGNRIATWATVSSTYDLDGNLTGDGTNTYTWNARNQLTSASGGATASFAYDAFGRRRAKTVGGSTTSFFYDGSSLVQELSSGSPTANLLGGTGIDEILTRTDAGGTSAVLTDALGSTSALTNESGAVQTSYTYEPFGQATVTGASTSNSVGFTGREADGTGLDFYRARYYDPRRQRFISEDPAGFGGGSTNLFAYVNNRPTVLTDPSGRFPLIAVVVLPLAGCIGGGLGETLVAGWSARKFWDGCLGGSIIGLAALGGLAAAELAAEAENLAAKATAPPPTPSVPTSVSGPPTPSGPTTVKPAGSGNPKPTPNFVPPTNPPQLPPPEIPDGWRIREMPATQQYPDGYWKLEKPMKDGSWQPIDPSTMKPGGRPQTHVPFPPAPKQGGGS